MKANGPSPGGPVRAFADRPHSYRQRPHRSAELALRPPPRRNSKTEYADAIEADLEWLGIRPDLLRRQSERMAAYDEAAARLKDLGRLYPAYETAEELDRRRKRQQARGLPPIYDRAALRLSADERAALEASGRKPHWRL